MDRTAYLKYVTAGGRDFRPAKRIGSTVSLDELMRRTEGYG
jgi:hypothetical protein